MDDKVPAFVGLLRAINLGGSTQLRMSDLADLLRQRGFEDVHTVLQSGNVVFRRSAARPAMLEQTLEEALSEQFGLPTQVFVRTASEWRSIVNQNPFPREAKEDPAHLVVTTLKRAPEREEWAALQAAIRGREKVESAGRHAYIVYPDGIGSSKLTAALIERKLGTRGTSRNWNTVRRLDQLASS
jgi:uncharacterized protein (DUF1697 family)